MEQLFLDILQNSRGTIYRICKAYAFTAEDEKDLFQEVSLQIWKSLPKFEGKASVNTWVYRITLNVCMRARDKNDKKKFKQLDHVYLQNLTSDTNPSKEYKELYACIRKLDEADKGIILLYLEDISYREIAQITGLTENHVAVKIKRIKAKLFTSLNTVL